MNGVASHAGDENDLLDTADERSRGNRPRGVHVQGIKGTGKSTTRAEILAGYIFYHFLNISFYKLLSQ